MLRCQRPAEPPDFASTVAMEKANILRLSLNRRLTSDDFPALWRKYKSLFSEKQNGKCGFCEGRVTGLHVGDVEHFRPKAMLHDLPSDRTQWGREEPHGTKVLGRNLKTPICEWGYHWLAYEWSNYLLACESCNRWWKKNLFPVLESPRRLPPDPVIPETPLLLNPFEGPDSVVHLSFTELGQVEAYQGSRYGRATIDTCGLDRESLRQCREEKSVETYRLLRILWEALEKEHVAAAAEAGSDLLRLGDEKGSHPGMVRAIVVQYTEVASWEAFAQYISSLAEVVGKPKV